MLEIVAIALLAASEAGTYIGCGLILLCVLVRLIYMLVRFVRGLAREK